MKRILMIDDSMIQHRILDVMLRDQYETLTSTSGLDGIRVAKREQPDLILLDYDMPFLSGKDTLKKLKEQEETRHIPVIFLTGMDGRKDVEQALQYRPQGYLLKPVEKDRLLKTIEQVFLQEGGQPGGE